MKKKKRKVFSTKQKLLIAGGAVLAFFVILLIIMSFTKDSREQQKTQEDNLYIELSTVKDVVEYLESEFISMTSSSVDGYDLDIFVSFKYNLYEGDTSKEIFFKNFYEKIAAVTNRKSFRLIDKTKGITIEVKSTSNGISEVKINGQTDYYRQEESKRSKQKQINAERLNLSIDSDILQKLIDEKWATKSVNLGTKESSYYKYDIYFEEGYEVRTIKGKVYNIVFTNKYPGKVVGGYKVGTSMERITSDLGTTYTERDLIGYKTNDFYVWFSEDEISIYPIYKVDYTEFEGLAKKYNESKDANDFMYQITDIWQDYDLYEYNQNYVKIRYANKGVNFEYSVEKPYGIIIYENYWGDLRDNVEDYSKIYCRFDENLTGEAEVERRETKAFYDDKGIEEDPIHFSSKFDLLMNTEENGFSHVKIKSSYGDYPNNEFDENLIINSYVWADDTHLIYGISEDGMYVYDAENRTTEKILEGKDPYTITNYDRNTNTIEYDGKQAKVEL